MTDEIRKLCTCGHEWMEHSDTWGCVSGDDEACDCIGFVWQRNTDTQEA